MRVTGAWTQLLTDWLDAQGLTAPAIRARLAAYAPDDVVPLNVWCEALAQAAASQPHLPAPGLSIGAGVQPRHVGVLGYLVLASDTLAEAVATYQRYERLFYGVDLVQVDVGQHEVDILWPRRDSSGLLADETAIAALVTFCRKQLEDAPPPSHISFVHDMDAARLQACEAFFGCTVAFRAPSTRVRFPLSYMAMPMPHREPGLKALLDRQAQALLAALPAPGPFDTAVQQILLRMLPDGDVAIDKVASALHQSTRTLQRRLAHSGMTWQHLLDRTREQLARHYLRDPALSLAEIALLLGYSEQSAFTRSFRRWTGHTPLSFRTQSVHA